MGRLFVDHFRGSGPRITRGPWTPPSKGSDLGVGSTRVVPGKLGDRVMARVFGSTGLLTSDDRPVRPPGRLDRYFRAVSSLRGRLPDPGPFPPSVVCLPTSTPRSTSGLGEGVGSVVRSGTDPRNVPLIRSAPSPVPEAKPSSDPKGTGWRLRPHRCVVRDRPVVPTQMVRKPPRKGDVSTQVRERDWAVSPEPWVVDVPPV